MALGAVIGATMASLAAAKLAFPDMDEGEWAAWVQGVGTVAAVIAAIVIDQGEARRQRAAVQQAQLQRFLDWESTVRWVAEELRRLSALDAATNPAPLIVDQVQTDLSAMARALTMYAHSEPPSPELGLAMARMMAICDRCLGQYLGLSKGAASRVTRRVVLDFGVDQADAALAAYEAAERRIA